MLLFTCMHVCQGLVLSPKELKRLNFLAWKLRKYLGKKDLEN